MVSADVPLSSDGVCTSRIRTQMIPGLLQNEEYARAVLHAAPDAGAADEVDRQVALRMERQAILTRTRPVDFWVILSETACSGGFT
jgi:hypothetical protein